MWPCVNLVSTCLVVEVYANFSLMPVIYVSQSKSHDFKVR